MVCCSFSVAAPREKVAENSFAVCLSYRVGFKVVNGVGLLRQRDQAMPLTPDPGF